MKVTKSLTALAMAAPVVAGAWGLGDALNKASGALQSAQTAVQSVQSTAQNS